MKRNDSQVLMELLTDVFAGVIKKINTVQLQKYIIQDNQRYINETISPLVRSLIDIAVSDTDLVTAKNGRTYSVAKYKVPKQLVDFVSAGCIYASKDAAHLKKPITIEGATSTIALDPNAFNKIFEDINRYTDKSFELINVDKQTITLENIQYLVKGDRAFKLHDNGFDLETCTLIGLYNDSLIQYLRGFDAETKEGLVEWLLP